MTNNTQIQLASQRLNLDQIDKRLIKLLSGRTKIVQNIGALKQANNIPPLDPSRWQQVIKSRVKWGTKLNLSSIFITNIMNVIHKHSLLIQEEQS